MGGIPASENGYSYMNRPKRNYANSVSLLLWQGSGSLGRCVGTVVTFVETVVETIHFQIGTVETGERGRKLQKFFPYKNVPTVSTRNTSVSRTVSRRFLGVSTKAHASRYACFAGSSYSLVFFTTNKDLGIPQPCARRKVFTRMRLFKAGTGS